jgi:hypothetical protein
MKRREFVTLLGGAVTNLRPSAFSPTRNLNLVANRPSASQTARVRTMLS